MNKRKISISIMALILVVLVVWGVSEDSFFSENQSKSLESVQTASCPPPPMTKLPDKKLDAIGIIKPDGIVAAQGILSFMDDQNNKLALTTGYWGNNASIISGNDFTDVEHKNLSTKNPPNKKSGLIANVFEQNGKLWWPSYEGEVIFITDLDGENLSIIKTPNVRRPIGITGDPDSGLVLIPGRETNTNLYIFDEENLDKEIILHLRGDMNSAPHEIDFFNGCLFLVESDEAKIWTLEMDDVLKGVRYVRENQDIATYDLNPKVWFTSLDRPQHQSIHNKMLYIIDTDNFSVMKLGLDTGTFQKLILPIQHIFRGLTVTKDGEIMLTGFTDPIPANQTAIFWMREVD
jgi:hypothetical protein